MQFIVQTSEDFHRALQGLRPGDVMRVAAGRYEETDMSELLLSSAERDRFVRWLTHEIATTQGIIAQMERIKTPEPMIRHFRAEAAAHELVRNKLAAIEGS